MSTGYQRLVEALQAEHAAIFGYGPVGAHLNAKVVDLARQAEAAHRARRDELVIRLADKRATPPAAEPVYVLPFPVTDQAAALRLAITIEERTAVLWRLALPDTTGRDRSMAINALVDCAVRATRFRLAAGTSPATLALPGVAR